MADPRPEWTVYDGEGGGPSTPVVRSFEVIKGDGIRMTSKDEPTNTGTTPEADPWVTRLQAAVDIVEAALIRAHHAELERLETRLVRQTDEEVRQIKADHEAAVETLTDKYNLLIATQSAGTEQALRDVDAGHQVFAESAQALHAEIDAARTEEIALLQKRLKAVIMENEALRAQVGRR